MAKRLYVVRVEFEFAAMAEDEDEACGHTDEAIRDTGFLEEYASADLIRFHKFPKSEKALPVGPDGWEDDALVYGADKDTTLAQAIEEERKIQDAEKQG